MAAHDPEVARPSVPGYALGEPLTGVQGPPRWRARREVDGLDVVLVVRSAHSSDVPALMGQAADLGGVAHPTLARLHDAVVLRGQSGRPAAVVLAVQPAAGGSLGQVVARRGPLTAAQVVGVLAPVTAALAALHAQGRVYAGLGAHHVHLLDDGAPLLDACAVLALAGAGPLLAPEVLEGLPLSPESDVWAVGALARACLTRPDGSLRRVPPPLAAVIEECLASEPADRPAAATLPAALTAAVRPVGLVPLTAAAAPAGQEAIGAEATGARATGAGAVVAELRRRAGGDRVHDPGGLPGRLLHPARRRGARRAPVGQRRDGLRGRGTALTAGSGAVVLLLGGAVALGALQPRWSDDGSVTTDPVPPSPPVSASSPAQREEPGAAVAVPPLGEPVREVWAALVAAPAEADPAASAAPSPAPVAAPALVATGVSDDGPDDVGVVVQRLLDARAAAWRRGDPELLDVVLAQESPAMAQDGAALAEAADRGLTYPDLSFTASDVEVVDEAGDRLVVTATVRRLPTAVIGAAEKLPEAVEEVRLELRPHGEGWRLWAWE